MQQVNLYLKEFRPKFDFFSARTLLMVAAVYVVALVVWSIAAYNSVERATRETDAIIADVKSEEAKLGRLKGFGRPGDKTQFEDTVSQMRSAIDNRAYIKKLVRENAFGNDQGFSKVLTALSKASVRDLNLAEFGLSNGGRELFLSGRAVRIDAAPEYIRTFQQDPAMSSVTIGVLRLTKAPGGHEFRLGEWSDKNISSFDDVSNAGANHHGQK